MAPGIRVPGIRQDADQGRRGNQLVQQLQSLAAQMAVQLTYPSEIAAGPIEAGNQSKLDRVGADHEYDRDGVGSCLDRERRGERSCEDDRYLPAHELRRQRRQSIVVGASPAVFDRDVPSFDEAGFLQAIMEPG